MGQKHHLSWCSLAVPERALVYPAINVHLVFGINGWWTFCWLLCHLFFCLSSPGWWKSISTTKIHFVDVQFNFSQYIYAEKCFSMALETSINGFDAHANSMPNLNMVCRTHSFSFAFFLLNFFIHMANGFFVLWQRQQQQQIQKTKKNNRNWVKHAVCIMGNRLRIKRLTLLDGCG